MDTALLLIDIQNDYFPGGKMELVGAEQAGENAGKLLSACRDSSVPVIHIQHFSLRPGSTFFIPDTPGVDIHSSVTPLPEEIVLRKHYPNSFRGTELEMVLKEKDINRLIVAGMMTHICVDTTVRAAFDLGFDCTLIHDACATRDLVWNDQTVSAQQVQSAYMAALGSVFSKVLNTAEMVKKIREGF